ncbi:MAG: ACP S-malonyltransferase [Hahellaceae bacterium]|jgi:[acyl-carrier-protein] S-malonyltransferase|nr:ACP S-malonyltransferase [Hahellaceae bacterium]MCP5212069.1 ACP S-malonyltransferase [Hahellaceae bacterium]
MSTAFVFPGQGSQFVGMMKEYLEVYPSIEAVYQVANDALGYDLRGICLNGPIEDLNKTAITQPALLASSYAIWKVWCENRAERPTLLAGHSLGEYSAMVAASVLKFEDAIRLVAYRGELMQQAVPEGVGAMAAVLGLDDQSVVDICAAVAKRTNTVVSAVNFNSPGQVVIAGVTESVALAGQELKAAGAKKVMPLPISVPCHCDLMKGAGDKLAQFIDGLEVNAPQIPVIQNYTADFCNDPEIIKKNLVAQLYSPVLWTQSVLKMQDMCITKVIECGVGKVLTGLTKRVSKSFECDGLATPESIGALVIDV